MTTPRKDAPVTEAGRLDEEWAALRNSLSKAYVAKDIDAALTRARQRIEAATAARGDEIDVERLAEAIRSPRVSDIAIHYDPARAARVIAAEYARLHSEHRESTDG